MKNYFKLAKSICGKCAEHCCTYQLDYEIEKIFLKKNEEIMHDLIARKEAKEDCLAYHEGKCLAYDYRPSVCRKHYCNKWDGIDKRIIIKGNLRESSIEKLAKKIKFTLKTMDLNYLIFSKNLEKDYEILSESAKIPIQIESEKSLFNLEDFDELKGNKIIITNTSVEDFLKNVDFEYGKIRTYSSLDGLFMMNAWFYAKNEILSRDLVKVL